MTKFSRTLAAATLALAIAPVLTLAQNAPRPAGAAPAGNTPAPQAAQAGTLPAKETPVGTLGGDNQVAAIISPDSRRVAVVTRKGE